VFGAAVLELGRPFRSLPGECLEPAGLGPAVAGDQFGGDAVQPGPDIIPAEVISGSFAKRHEERLGRHVVGGGDVVQPSGRIPVDLVDVPVEESGESVGIGQ
jgi:hypothetical protein